MVTSCVGSDGSYVTVSFNVGRQTVDHMYLNTDHIFRYNQWKAYILLNLPLELLTATLADHYWLS